MIGALVFFPLGAIGQTTADPHDPRPVQRVAAEKKPNPRPIPPGANPLWGIPISLLSATRERPIFSASRRPPVPLPPPMPVAEAPPPPPGAPEPPPFTLIGTAVGMPRNVALVLDQTTKSLVRLHVGEAASGWYLRSVDPRTMTVEKNGHVAILTLPAPAKAPILAARVKGEF
jgi:general secretion pathway protein N